MSDELRLTTDTVRVMVGQHYAYWVAKHQNVHILEAADIANAAFVRWFSETLSEVWNDCVDEVATLADLNEYEKLVLQDNNPYERGSE